MSSNYARSVLNSDTLLNIGFRDIGAWTISKTGSALDYDLDGDNAELLLHRRNALYAFVQNGEVRYIGKTARTLKDRLAGYKTPHCRQITNWRCNKKIREQLRAGNTVRIFVFAMPSYLANFRYGNFNINLAAGLEDSLIEEFDPPWNGRDSNGPVTEEAERERTEEDTAHAPDAVRTPPSPLDISQPSRPTSFQIKLGKTYYDDGIINPGVDASRCLGDHDDPITIYLGNMNTPLLSRIDREANSSGAVRVMRGKRHIADWIRTHFAPGDVVEALVLSRNSILLLPKGAMPS